MRDPQFFWKTLYNWCTYIEYGSLPAGAVWRFVVVANGTITPGSIQEIFANAHSNDEARKAFDDAKITILGTPPDDSAVDVYAALPDTYRKYIRYLFNKSRERIVCDIIKAMEIEIHCDIYDEDLLNRFHSQTIPVEYADLLLTDMLGQVTQTVESFTKNNKPACIAAKDYRKALNKQIRACDTNSVRKIFETLSAFVKNAKFDIQIIVTEHADDDI